MSIDSNVSRVFRRKTSSRSGDPAEGNLLVGSRPGCREARREINLGGVDRVGTHVLLIDRVRDTVYAMPRESAEIFLANINSIPLPTRPCLCALLDCRSCPVRTCPRAGRTDPFDTDEVNPALTRAKRSNSVDSRHKSRC